MFINSTRITSCCRENQSWKKTFFYYLLNSDFFCRQKLNFMLEFEKNSTLQFLCLYENYFNFKIVLTQTLKDSIINMIATHLNRFIHLRICENCTLTCGLTKYKSGLALSFSDSSCMRRTSSRRAEPSADTSSRDIPPPSGSRGIPATSGRDFLRWSVCGVLNICKLCFNFKIDWTLWVLFGQL